MRGYRGHKAIYAPCKPPKARGGKDASHHSHMKAAVKDMYEVGQLLAEEDIKKNSRFGRGTSCFALFHAVPVYSILDGLGSST